MYKRRVSSRNDERDMSKHELSLNSGVIGSDVISGAHSFKLRAKNLRHRYQVLMRRNTETKLIVFTGGTSRHRRLYAFNDLIYTKILYKKFKIH